MDISQFNQRAWDQIAESQQKWFVPVSVEQIERARQGILDISLTATRNVPPEWLGEVSDKKVLCLAAGGGHQGPLLAASGARVTVVDFSESQLEIDRQVAQRERLELITLRRDMRELGNIGPFDLVINPCSVNFCPDATAVWREVWRVLKPGGRFMAGMIQPCNYLFDESLLQHGQFRVANRIPWSGQPDPEGDSSIPVEFGHSLSDLLAAQLQTGFKLIDMFEDRWGADDALSERLSVFLATLASRPTS